jgi:hypothetical protein
MMAFLSALDVFASNSSLLQHGLGLLVPSFVLGGFSFVATRKGFAAARQTGPANYAGGMYLFMLVFRWVYLVVGLIGLGLVIAAVI